MELTFERYLKMPVALNGRDHGLGVSDLREVSSHARVEHRCCTRHPRPASLPIKSRCVLRS